MPGDLAGIPAVALAPPTPAHPSAVPAPAVPPQGVLAAVVLAPEVLVLAVPLLEVMALAVQAQGVLVLAVLPLEATALVVQVWGVLVPVVLELEAMLPVVLVPVVVPVPGALAGDVPPDGLMTTLLHLKSVASGEWATRGGQVGLPATATPAPGRLVGRAVFAAMARLPGGHAALGQRVLGLPGRV